tara:strand:- start:587 stop:1087 length:501 start_codon:yes stop_codon:yes gene_type:complete
MTSQLRVDKILPVDGAPTNGGGGIVQVQQTHKTDLFATSTTATFQDITGFTVTITPKFTTSKILIMVHLTHQNNSAATIVYKLFRGSTEIGASTVDSGATYTGIAGASYDANRGAPVAFNFLDSPNTTSATTYKLQVAHTGGAYRFNSRSGTWDCSSTITAMEVSA